MSGHVKVEETNILSDNRDPLLLYNSGTWWFWRLSHILIWGLWQNWRDLDFRNAQKLHEMLVEMYSSQKDLAAVFEERSV